MMNRSAPAVRLYAWLTIVLVIGVLGGCRSGNTAPPTSRAATAPSLRTETTMTLMALATPAGRATRKCSPQGTVSPTRQLPTPPVITPCPSANQRPTPATTSPLPAGAVLTPDNVSQLTEQTHWGKGAPRALQFSADGRWLVVTWEGKLTQYDACTLEERR